MLISGLVISAVLMVARGVAHLHHFGNENLDGALRCGFDSIVFGYLMAVFIYLM